MIGLLFRFAEQESGAWVIRVPINIALSRHGGEGGRGFKAALMGTRMMPPFFRILSQRLALRHNICSAVMI